MREMKGKKKSVICTLHFYFIFLGKRKYPFADCKCVEEIISKRHENKTNVQDHATLQYIVCPPHFVCCRRYDL